MSFNAKSIIQCIGAYIKQSAQKFWLLSVPKRILVLAVLFSLPFSLLIVRDKTAELPKEEEKIRQVSVASVLDLSADVTTLSLFGTVTSKSEATIRAESGGKIVGVYKKLGDYVAAGTVIAEFENSGERAQVLSAEGAFEAASLGKDIASISLSSSDSALDEAKTQALNTISSVYTGLDDAVRTKTDTAWKNPETRDAKLSVTVSDAKLIIELESERIAIGEMLRAREVKNSTLTLSSDLVAELTLVEKEANIVKNYLDNLSLAFNRALADGNASQGTIDTWKGAAALARSSVGGLLASIAGTRNALSNSISANKIAEKNSGTTDVNMGSSADAQLKSALGNLRGAQSRLEKTIIRSPISGTINSLSINTGDFVSPYTEVAVVSNNGALEVLAYVTEGDAKKVSVGAKVAIDQYARGVITRVAPALDPKTKKIEVRIGITSPLSLTNGQSVRVEVTQAEKPTSTSEIKIPLSALKIVPSGMIAFTVNEGGTLVAHEVKTGALLGENITVVDGLTPDMRIVTDARGLQEGMSVLIK